MLPPSLPQPGVQWGWGSTHRWVPTELTTRQEWGTPTPALGLPGTGAMQDPSLEPQHPALQHFTPHLSLFQASGSSWFRHDAIRRKSPSPPAPQDRHPTLPLCLPPQNQL